MGARRSPSRRLRAAAQVVAARTLLGLARWLPRRVLLGIGALAGSLAFHLDRKHTAVALRNLETAFGSSKSADERRRIALACWRHYGRITADTAAFHRLSPADIGTRVRYDGVDDIREAYREGRGVLLISGHFGHWELTAYMQGFLGCPLLLITKPMEEPRLEAMLARMRSGSGNEIVAKADAVRASLRALDRGLGVAVMIDQDAREAGIFVPFFGRQASTIATVGTLHLRTGAAIVATFSYPESDGGWRIVYLRLRFPDLTGDRERDVHRITAETTRLLEDQVRERPDLWLWMHRRWKTSPPAPP